MRNIEWVEMPQHAGLYAERSVDVLRLVLARREREQGRGEANHGLFSGMVARILVRVVADVAKGLW